MKQYLHVHVDSDIYLVSYSQWCRKFLKVELNKSHQTIKCTDNIAHYVQEVTFSMFHFQVTQINVPASILL